MPYILLSQQRWPTARQKRIDDNGQSFMDEGLAFSYLLI